jgi:CheY-like chemotaxis protein
VGRRPIRLFMVEDDEIDVRCMRRGLKRAGSRLPLRVARDGDEAIAALRREPDPGGTVVVLDLQMPRMNGLEFLAELRSDQRLCGTPVFVLTTSDAPEDMERAYAHQVAGYVMKRDAGDDFEQMVSLLDRFCAVVALPD